MLEQFRIAAVERRVETLPRGVVVLGADQGDDLAVDQVHPLQPLQREVAAEEAGRAGEQHGAHLAARSRQRRCRGQGGLVEELVQRQVAGVHLGRVAAVHGVVGGPLGPTGALRLDVGGDGGQVAGRADDHPDRHVDVEDVVQKIGKGQRRQRVSAEVGERRVGGHVGRGRTEQRTRRPADRFQNGTVGTVLPQRPQHVGLAVGQVDVELLELGAVVLLELGTGQLADAGQQTVLQRERRCLDEEVARNLVGLQAGLARDALQRVAQQRLDRGDVAADAGQRVVGRDDHRQHVGAGAVAVHEDLTDRRVATVGRLQLGDRDELALRELQHVVAAVHVGQLIGRDLGHHVTGVIPAVGVEEFGRHLGSLVVAGDQIR